MAKLFKTTTQAEQDFSLASFLPQGKAFDISKIPSSNMGKFITGLAQELKRAYDDINNLSEDYDINVTDELLSNWESALGIPDNCFTGTGSKANRRLHVLLKFAKMNVQTAPQMVELCVALGFTDTTIIPLQDTAFPPYDVPFFPSVSPGSRYVIVVFATDAVTNIPPYDVPFTPAADNRSLLKCIFDIIKPSNVEVVFGNYGVGSFEPTDIQNCTCWLRSGDYDTLTLDASNNLTQWLDKAEDNNATESVIPPKWIASQLNGYGVVRFSDNESMSISGTNIFGIPDGDNTIFIVVKQNSGTQTDHVLSFSNTGIATHYIRYQGANIVSGINSVQYSGSVGSDFEIVRARREGTTQAITINGNVETTNSLATNPAYTTDTVNIGSLNGIYNYFTGDIAEIIIYSRSLTTTEIATVENYLTNRYAL